MSAEYEEQDFASQRARTAHRIASKVYSLTYETCFGCGRDDRLVADAEAASPAYKICGDCARRYADTPEKAASMKAEADRLLDLMSNPEWKAAERRAELDPHCVCGAPINWLGVGKPPLLCPEHLREWRRKCGF